jgi:predicted ribosomally synthesized peptide with nif11-like leader
MSEEQLQSLLEKLKHDPALVRKLKAASNFEEGLALIKAEGFDVSKAELLRYQARQTLEMNEQELEGVAGGANWCGSILCILALSIGGCDGTD